MKSSLNGIEVLMLTALLAVFLTACGGGGDGSGGNGGTSGNATITGTVAGTVVVAIDENDNEVDRDTATGTPQTFTLTVPIGGDYRLYLIENEGTTNERMFVLYWGTTNVFTISSTVTIDLGFVDTSSGVAVPTNDPFNQGATDGGNNYSNATMSGTWIALDGSSARWYISALGNGVITDVGAFFFDSPPGSYAVQTDGSFTLTVTANGGTEVFNTTGQFDSPTHAIWTVDSEEVLELEKVVYLTAAQGTWTGTLIEYVDGTFITYNISFRVDATGNVTNFTGFFGPTTGKMYALTTGEATGFFWTGEINQFNQIRINGTLTGNSFTGTFEVDNDDPESGTVSLTRTTM